MFFIAFSEFRTFSSDQQSGEIASTSSAIVTQNTSSENERPKIDCSLSKDVVKKRIEDGMYSVREAMKRKSKTNSQVWKYIRNVYDENKNLVHYFFSCSKCSTVITNLTLSTTPFIRHIKGCTAGKSQLSITQYVLKSSDVAQNTVKISMQNRQKLKDGMSEYICNDLRPFSSVEGKGFVASMCDSFQLGQAYPNLSRDEFIKVLPGRTAIQKEIESKVDVAKKLVKTKLRHAFREFGGFACTSDLWSDDYRQRSYITVNAIVPVLTPNEIIYERYVIGVEEVCETIKTKEVVQSHILDILSWYSFTENDAKSIYFVTDRGSNYKTMDKFNRANCYAHMLHNIVKAICKDQELSEVISNAKDLVRYIKKAGLNYRCDLQLKSYCETRWSTAYTMLSSILKKYDDVYKVLDERRHRQKKHRNCLQLIECLHKSTLSTVVNILEPFKVWTDLLEADKCITIHRVWPIYKKVMSHLSVSREQEEEAIKSHSFNFMESMKSLGREYIRSIKSDFEPTMEQNIALALYVKTKKLPKLPVEVRESTYAKINELISKEKPLPPNIQTKAPKRKSLSLFDSFSDSEDDGGVYSRELKYCPELEKYLHTQAADEIAFEKGDAEIFSQWWFKHRYVYPNLFKLFMRISCIPASSAPSERCFSITGQIITEKRSCILPENVSNIIMCRNLYVN